MIRPDLVTQSSANSQLYGMYITCILAFHGYVEYLQDNKKPISRHCSAFHLKLEISAVFLILYAVNLMCVI